MRVGSTASTTWEHEREGGREVGSRSHCTATEYDGVSQLAVNLFPWQLHQFTSSFKNSEHQRCTMTPSISLVLSCSMYPQSPVQVFYVLEGQRLVHR